MDDPVNKIFGMNVRLARERRGVSVNSLAEHLGVTVSTVLRYEAGYRRPRPETVYQIACHLEVRISDLFQSHTFRYKTEPSARGVLMH